MILPIVYREELREYDFGPGHPFRGDRYEIFPPFLTERLTEGKDFRFVTAEPATDSDMATLCREDYIRFSRDFYRAANLGQELGGSAGGATAGDAERYQWIDNRPPGRPGKLEEAARLIVGQAKAACDIVQSGESEMAVALGGGMHHAYAGHGEGFCIYNDVAFAARYLRETHKLERVLILDSDAHAGNGTADYFDNDPNVLLIDLHQDPRTVYPGSGFAEEIGAGDGRGYTVNVPLPIFSGEASYRLIFDEIVRPVAAEFRPQAIIRNGGSDPHAADQLTNLGLSVTGFRMIGQEVRGMAADCGAKVIDLIGSGYNHEVLPQSWLGLIAGLADIDVDIEEPSPVPAWMGVDRSLDETRIIIQDVKRYLKDYWTSLR
jgi:acetoin utilization protein AcuC